MSINEELYENVITTLMDLPVATSNHLSEIRTKILKIDVFDDYVQIHFSNVRTICD